MPQWGVSQGKRSTAGAWKLVCLLENHLDPEHWSEKRAGQLSDTAHKPQVCAAPGHHGRQDSSWRLALDEGSFYRARASGAHAILGFTEAQKKEGGGPRAGACGPQLDLLLGEGAAVGVTWALVAQCTPGELRVFLPTPVPHSLGRVPLLETAHSPPLFLPLHLLLTRSSRISTFLAVTALSLEGSQWMRGPWEPGEATAER